jgi:hypothetical protein
MPFFNTKDVRNPMMRQARVGAARGSSVPASNIRSPQGSQARPMAPVQQGTWYGNPLFGGAGRTSTAQGITPVSSFDAPKLASQVLYPAPSTLHLKPSTGRPSYTMPFQSAPADRHAGTNTTAVVLRPYGGPMPSPLLLGSYNQMGQASVKRPIIQPPQPTMLPTIQKKVYLFSR